MEKYEIIEMIARKKMVEKVVLNVALKSSLTSELKDLTQMVYLLLLEYDSQKIEELWESNQILYFISAIVMHNYRSNTSAYHYAIRRFQQNSEEITGKDWKDEN